MTTKEKECLVCGKNYKYCAHCNKNGVKETWRNTYCCSSCREIFNTCSNYEGKLISQEEAYNKLTELNVDVNTVKKSVKESVEKIMNYSQPKVEETKEVEERPKRRPRRRKINFDE